MGRMGEATLTFQLGGWVRLTLLPFERVGRVRSSFFLNGADRWGYPSFLMGHMGDFTFLSFWPGRMGEATVPFGRGRQARLPFLFLNGEDGRGYPSFLMEWTGNFSIHSFLTRRTGEAAIPFEWGGRVRLPFFLKRADGRGYPSFWTGLKVKVTLPSFRMGWTDLEGIWCLWNVALYHTCICFFLENRK
jgi:hypothetical protein